MHFCNLVVVTFVKMNEWYLPVFSNESSHSDGWRKSKKHEKMEKLKLVILFHFLVRISLSCIKALFLPSTLLSSGSQLVQLVFAEHKRSLCQQPQSFKEFYCDRYYRPKFLRDKYIEKSQIPAPKCKDNLEKRVNTSNSSTKRLFSEELFKRKCKCGAEVCHGVHPSKSLKFRISGRVVEHYFII